MHKNSKIHIYKGMIQYLLDSTTYPLHRIANLSNSSVESLQAIYCHHQLPENRHTELSLLKLFTTIVDLEQKGQWHGRNGQYK